MTSRTVSLLAAVGISVMTVTVVSACGSASTPAAGRTTSASPTPVVTTTSASPTPTVPTTPPVLVVAGPLRPLIIPTPPAYHVSTESDASNGPIDATAFDAEVGTGASSRLGFSDGYELEYDANGSDDAYTIDLFRFGSATEAAAFTALSVPEDADEESPERPTRSAVAGMPGAVAIFPTVSDRKNGTFYDILGERGVVAFEVSLGVDDVRATFRTLADQAALRQYARLVGTTVAQAAA